MTTQILGTQIKDGSLTNVDVAENAAIARSKIQYVSALTEKLTIANDDTFEGSDSEASNIPKKFKWSSIVSTIRSSLKVFFKTYHGVESIGTVSFNSTNQTLSITSITYWYLGEKYTSSSTLTCNINNILTLSPNTTYYFYFDNSIGTLTCSNVSWNVKTVTPVCTVFWNGTIGAIGAEWHNYKRDLDWHLWAHKTIGVQYDSGLALTKPSVAFPSSLQIEGGDLYDEDLLITIIQQTLCRILYRVDGSTYTFVSSSVPYAGTTNAPKYLNTTTYTLTDVGASNFAVMWVYACNDIDKPIWICPTHATSSYNTIAGARAEVSPALYGFNLSPEFKLIYKFIYKGNGEFQEATDYRKSSSVPSGGTPSLNATAVSFLPTEAIPSTTVQTAIEYVHANSTYTHPTGDGNLHVIATSTENDGKVLTAGPTAGSLSWEQPNYSLRYMRWMGL